MGSKVIQSRNSTGALGEEVASRYLVAKGYHIVDRNYRRPWGEIDIIAEKAGVLHFVEVKTLSKELIPNVSRENNDYRPEEQVHSLKLKKLARTAQAYMNSIKSDKEYQIDVIGVFLNYQKKIAKCRFFEQVLE